VRQGDVGAAVATDQAEARLATRPATEVWDSDNGRGAVVRTGAEPEQEQGVQAAVSG
jgi:hypothetical protein